MKVGLPEALLQPPLGDSYLYVPKIMDLIVVRLMPRTYQDENALCCGSYLPGHVRIRPVKTSRPGIWTNMQQSGAEACIFNCHGCMNALSSLVASRGIKPLHMIDLCRMAIGEKLEMES